MSPEGLVLLGPGSEWFWSMAQFVVVAVTLIGLYLQLRVARGANAFGQMAAFEEEWASEKLCLYRIAILEVVRDARPLDDVLWAVIGVCSFWERLGSLARAGHLEVRLLRNGSGPDCQTWWGQLAPWVERMRREERDHTIYENFSWLAAAMDREDRRMGVPVTVDDDFLARTAERRLATNRGQLAMGRSLRTVVLESREPRATPDSIPGIGEERPAEVPRPAQGTGLADAEAAAPA